MSIRCCWSAAAQVSSPGCVCGRKLFPPRKCWSWWHRPGPLWSAWGGNLAERQQIRGVITCLWTGYNFNDSPNITKASTCKQSTKAVLCHNPAHHTEGGGGGLTGHWGDITQHETTHLKTDRSDKALVMKSSCAHRPVTWAPSSTPLSFLNVWTD